jgi:hypothetical protein
MVMAERRQTRDILVEYREAFGAKLSKRRLHIDGVPQHNHVDDQSKCAELVFVSFPVTLAQLAAFVMEYDLSTGLQH